MTFVESWLGLSALSGAFIRAALLTGTAATVWFRMRSDALAVVAQHRGTAISCALIIPVLWLAARHTGDVRRSARLVP